MAKKIIILRDIMDTVGYRDIDMVFWFDIPVGEELPQPEKTSAYADATPEEVSALRAGTVIEETFRVRTPSDFNPTELKSFAVDLYNARENAVTVGPGPVGYPGKSYGTYWDGNTWTSG